MAATKPTFRELNEQLEAIMAKLRAEDVDIDEALSLHKQGIQLIEQLEQRLTSAEHTISKLKPKKS